MNANNSVAFPDPRTRRMAVVPDPADTLLLGDISYPYNHPPIQRLDPDQVGYKHNRRANLSFFDGHTTAISLNQTNALRVIF
jgi:prepilin-type processing-associated H-X9-DG protein